MEERVCWIRARIARAYRLGHGREIAERKLQPALYRGADFHERGGGARVAMDGIEIVCADVGRYLQMTKIKSGLL